MQTINTKKTASICILLIIILGSFLSLSSVSNFTSIPIVHAQAGGTAANPTVGPVNPNYDPSGKPVPAYDPNAPVGPRNSTSNEANPYSEDGGPSGGYSLGIPTYGTLMELLVPFFLRIINFLFAIVGLLAILGIVYSSYILATSGGNEQSIQTGKKGLTNAVVGLIIALSGYIIIYTIQYSLGI